MASILTPEGLNGHALTDDNLLISMGVYSGIEHINKFGENEDVVANTHEDIWTGGGDYPYPATALITHVSQTTNQVAALGAQVKLEGLNANWELQRQRTFLDGTDTTTPVELDIPLLRVWRVAVGSAVNIDSSIRVHNAAENVDYAIMLPDENQTMMAQYTIPRGYTGYMTGLYTSVISDATNNKEPDYTDVHLHARDNLFGHDWQIKHEQAIPKNGSGFQHFFKPYYKFVEMTDLKMAAFCKAEPGHVHAGFDIIIIKDNRTNP